MVVYFTDGTVIEFGGHEPETTNNRMEMQAAIQALQFFRQNQQREAIQLCTDSQYVIDGITKWINGWKKKGWKTAAGKPVLNQDLWQQMDAINQAAAVTWTYIRGHSGDAGNERADAIANGFARGQPPQLKNLQITENHTESVDIHLMPVAELSVSSSGASIVDRNKSLAATTMTDSSAINLEEFSVPRSERVKQLKDLIDSLRIADEIADQGYFISSSELAELMDVNASAVTSRGHEWTWRNWIVSRVKREGNQILWQLDRILTSEDVEDS